MKVLIAGALIAGAFVAGSAMTSIDTKAGEGSTKAAVSSGFEQLAGLTGEAAAAIPKTVNAVTPALQSSLTLAGDTLGGAGAAAAGATEGAGDPGAQP